MLTNLRVIRVCKASLVGSLALFFGLVAFNNITDFSSNYEYVRHVLMMDTTFKDQDVMWREVDSPLVHKVFYVMIIIWEVVIGLLGVTASCLMLKGWKGGGVSYLRGKLLANVAVTLSLLLWFGAFLIVGGEWFVMWQSRTWNGQEAAGRMFTVCGLILIFLNQAETDSSTAA